MSRSFNSNAFATAALICASALLLSGAMTGCSGGSSTGSNPPPAAAPPSVTSITPTTGSAAGGTPFTVRGSNFRAGLSVLFDGAPASNLNLVSSTEATGVTPAHAVGTVSVVVRNSDGQSGDLSNAFQFLTGFAISQVLPQAGVANSTTPTRILGTGFAQGATVQFGSAAATSVTFISATEIRAVAPAQTVGSADVRVTNPGGASTTRPGAFSYEPAPTRIFVSTNFEGGTFGGFHKEGPPDSSGNDCAPAVGEGLSGSGGVRCQMNSQGGAALLKFDYASPSNPPLAEPNGLYQRWAFRFDNIRQTDGGMKLLLNRSGEGEGNSPRWFQINVNYGGGSTDEFYVEADGDRIDGPLPGNTGFILKSNEWVCVQTHYKKQASGQGRARLWLDRGCNGEWKLYIDDVRSSYGATSPSNLVWWEIAQVWSDTGPRPLVVYVDDASAANGFIAGIVPPPSAQIAPSPAAGDRILFEDDFETRDLSRWDVIDTSCFSLESNTRIAASGNGALRLVSTSSTPLGEMTKRFSGGERELFVKFLARIDVSSPPSSVSMNLLSLIAHTGEQNFPAITKFSLNSLPSDPACTSNQPCAQQSPLQAAASLLSPGRWHEFIFHLRLNQPGELDGLQEVWIDGERQGVYTGLQWPEAQALRLAGISLEFSVPAGIHSRRVAWIDDLVVWAPR